MEIKTQIAVLSDGKITELFCMADDFCKFFNYYNYKRNKL